MTSLFTIRKCLIKSFSSNKLILVLVGSSVLLLYEFSAYNERLRASNVFVNSESNNSLYSIPEYVVYSYFKERESWSTSNLGSILFKNMPIQSYQHPDRRNRTFLILIWKHWKWLQARHVHSFNSSGEGDPLSHCSVTNCIFTGDDTFKDTADAVVIHLQRGEFPKTQHRNRNQRWIFLNDESAKNAFSFSPNRPKLSQLANVFNWSMTYRSDADVPVPYGRTVPLAKIYIDTDVFLPHIIPNWGLKRRDVLAAILISNCAVSYRMNYLNELKKYIRIDVHGRCSEDKKTSCPGHFRSDCQLMSDYLFYLVFENSMCKEYLTEKAFYHAYSKGAIPVIMGPSLSDCEKLLPPNSYLHVEHFKTALELAKEIVEISSNTDRLLSFHQWRKYFQIINEHGYFGTKSFHFCRVCEALNYNDGSEKIYNENDLKEFLDPLRTCS